MSYRETVVLAPERDCPGVAYRGDWPYGCGLLAGHRGNCVPFVPGGYLPPRLVTVLDWFDAAWKARGLPWWIYYCPICGEQAKDEISERSLAIYCDAENAERDEVRWEFRPCGCEGRELVSAE